MTGQEIDWGPWASVAVRAVGFLLWTHYAINALRDHRQAGNGMTYRAWVVAVVVWIGVVAILVGGFAQVWPQLVIASRTAGAIAGGAVLIGGLFLWIGRRWDKA